MKKLLFLFVLVVLVGCAPVEVSPTSIAVQIPIEITTALSIGFVALMTLGTAWLLQKIGLDLTGFATPVAMAVSIWVVAELQNIINTISETYDPILNIVLKIIVVVLGSVGGLALRHRPTSDTRLI